MPAQRFIALLRGINVTGRNIIRMADLRDHCTSSGWKDVSTYINSGNVLFSSPRKLEQLEKDFEQLVSKKFSLEIPVIIRRAADWGRYIDSNPLPSESAEKPQAVLLALSKRPPQAGALEKLRERAANGEIVEQVGDAFWVYYGNGVGGSKLSPALFDRVVGSPVTARNWRTVLKLGDLCNS